MKRVLVIDDDLAVGRAIKIWLEVEGAEVTHIDDGTSGLEAIAAGSFDVVIVDIFMPGINGFDMIKAVHQLKPELPIIAMSGLIYRPGVDSVPDVMDRATQIGAASALRKPFRPRDLLQAIEACIGGPLRQQSSGTESAC